MPARACAALAALTLAAPYPAAVEPPSDDAQRWTFRVLLDDRPVGEAVFALGRSESGRRRAESRVAFDIELLFVNVYRYRHEASEVWQGDCLQTATGRTDDNGDAFAVAGRRDDGAFRVEAGGQTRTLPDCVMSFAYWNPAVLERPRLLNLQTGDYEAVTATPDGEVTLRVAGAARRAARYRLAVQGQTITLWYAADDGRWLGLESLLENGYRLRYEPTR